jgi:MATE family multidrug resistance protein
MNTRSLSTDRDGASVDGAGDPMPFSRHLTRTIRLAAPVVVARAGLLVMVAVDSAMLGHYRTEELAFYAAANGAQIVMILIGVGLLQGTVILVAQARGAGDDRACGRYWRVSIVHGMVLGIVMGLLCLLGRWVLVATGQDAAVTAGGGQVLDMIAWGAPPLMMWVVCSHFLEGLSRPFAGMVVIFGAVLLNGLLNWVFIFGNLGGPELGAEGAAIATSLVRWVMFVALFVVVIRLPDAEALGMRGAIADFWATSKRLRRIGYPLGAARGLESGAFAALVMMAGHLGTVSLAAYQIGYNLIGLVFMCAIGTAAATTIRVGNAVGRRSAVDVARAGWAGVLVIVCVMAVFAGPFLGLGTPLATLYTDDPAVIPVAASLIAICGLILVFDGAQAVLMGSLRGVADVWVPPGLQLISWWAVSVPLGYGVAFALGGGVDGLMWGIFGGALSASVFLSLRFLVVARRPIARY